MKKQNIEAAQSQNGRMSKRQNIKLQNSKATMEEPFN
jgi:hypothetical protein